MPLSQRDLNAILKVEHHDPFSVLGMHDLPDGRVTVRAHLSWAAAASVLDLRDPMRVVPLKRRRGALFEAVVAGKQFPYRLRAETEGGDATEFEDPYRFLPVLSETDLYLWNEGTARRAYLFLGAHPRVHEGVEGTSFAVWAPNATRVSVVGDWNGWDGRSHPMRVRGASGVWEIFLPAVGRGARYKYEIKTPEGALLLKADPFGFRQEQAPSTASVVWGLPERGWEDEGWLKARSRGDVLRQPFSTYEVHLGSWRRSPDPDHRSLTYGEHAGQLPAYARDMGFTHLELMPVMEHPFEGSWGYQVTGFFAPTSRWGTPEEFQELVDACHGAGVGVLLDWVPSHFPTDAHGLSRFDGTALYEHEDPRLGFQKDWGTLVFNFGRSEVRSFLVSNALFWLDRYHADGLRVDAVASMLYLDYSRGAGEWVPNRHGGRENLEAIEFLKYLNTVVHEEFPGATTIAEESTAWPAVSRPVHLGGLGFGLKWNMGWMHDTLRYFSKDPVHRKHHHDDITFPLLYAFHENFVLVLSHDEVVHLKGSLLAKMPGDCWQQFANLRLLYAYMWAEPGKKLLFMGGEFGQGREWNHDTSLDWHLLDTSWHRGVHRFVQDLLGVYRDYPALWRRDGEPGGFEWVDFRDVESGVVCFVRWGADGDRPLLCVFNTTPVVRAGYRVGAPQGGVWRELLNSDDGSYEGSSAGGGSEFVASALPWHGKAFSLSLTLPPLGALYLAPA
ncbi:MAG: 1,4-alpha-glucan branching protein GlgB [Deltaproteobacteria bacterium]|nr:1,4-alpha-glucan branching protein GlgB [Deltaproteobacteria bacterium]